ncbi:MAG: putative sugar O-methyltransferase [Burkholderiales bacterium]
MRIFGFGKDSIVSQARERLFSIENIAGLPSHGIRWQAYVDRMRQSIKELASPDEVLRFAQGSVGFEHRGNIHHEGKFTAQYERELYAEFPHFGGEVDRFSDIEGSLADTTYEHKGRLVSNILFYLTRVVLQCLTHIPATNTILEIGGGYGAPARLWLSNPIRPAKCYIILDIPESLFFADVFLRREFGDASIFYVENGKPLNSDVTSRYKVILCPLSRHTALHTLAVDLAINTGSMQEMSEEWVDFYSLFLDNQQSRWFYSLNYFAQPITYLAESTNVWSPRLSPRWIARALRWNPAFVRMQTDRNYLEAIYEKNGDPLPAASHLMELAKAMESRVMTGELFVEYMDIVRREPTPRLMFALVRRVMREMKFHPKEVTYLVNALLASTDDKTAGYIAELQGYKTMLLEERSAGTEAIY